MTYDMPPQPDVSASSLRLPGTARALAQAIAGFTFLSVRPSSPAPATELYAVAVVTSPTPTPKVLMRLSEAVPSNGSPNNLSVLPSPSVLGGAGRPRRRGLELGLVNGPRAAYNRPTRPEGESSAAG